MCAEELVYPLADTPGIPFELAQSLVPLFGGGLAPSLQTQSGTNCKRISALVATAHRHKSVLEIIHVSAVRDVPNATQAGSEHGP